MNGELQLVPDVPIAFADLMLETHASRTTRDFSIALSGGSTARRCYEALSSRASDALWTTVELFWGDERCVPPDDPDSNLRLAAESLGPGFSRVRHLHPMDCTEGPDEYDALIAASRPLDVIHLGLGPDGHTASLFPGSPALDVIGRYVVLNDDPTGINPHRRLTFTYEAIERASLVVVTVEGSSKQTALSRVIDGDLTAPAASIRCERLIWLVDAAALGTSPPR